MKSLSCRRPRPAPRTVGGPRGHVSMFPQRVGTRPAGCRALPPTIFFFVGQLHRVDHQPPRVACCRRRQFSARHLGGARRRQGGAHRQRAPSSPADRAPPPTDPVQDGGLLGPRCSLRAWPAFRAFRRRRRPSAGRFRRLSAPASPGIFTAISLWILVLFLIYVTASEFIQLFGPAEMRRLLFASRPSELQLNRRPPPGCCAWAGSRTNMRSTSFTAQGALCTSSWSKLLSVSRAGKP